MGNGTKKIKSWILTIVYDNEGKFIYDINSQRVKIFDININIQGEEFFNPRKLDEVVQSEFLELLT